MKILKISALAALISAPLAAQETDRQWELAVFSEYVKSASAKEFLSDWQQVEAGGSIGLDLRTAINDYWDARAEFAFTKYDIRNGNGIKDSNRYGLDALYHFDNSDLYAFVGYKRFNNVRNYNAINVGAGYNFQLSDKASLFTEAAIYKDVNFGYIDQGIKLGFKYSFGATSPSPVKTNTQTDYTAPVPTSEQVKPEPTKTVLDSDIDGISDNIDQCPNTPTTDKVDANGCTLFKENQVAITLDISFANNSSIIETSAINDIERLAQFMDKYQDTSVVIEGHSSAVGNDNYNLMLSQKRANAVKAMLIEKFDIAENRLTAKGYGETQLLSAGNSAEDHQLNRRVVARIETIEKQAIQK